MILQILFIALCLYGTSAFKLTQKPDGRIVNGIEAKAEDFPYQVGIQIEVDNKYTLKCGGALITPTDILTAAHCFSNGTSGKVSMGSNIYQEGNIMAFDKVTVHEDYNTTNHANDIAIIHLDLPVPIDGVKIATIGLSKENLEEYSVVLASGFGMVYDGISTSRLYYTRMYTYLKDMCLRYYKRLIWDSMVCAGGADIESTCHGDSGGPLVVNWPEKPIHVGIVSFGKKSCVRGYPTVFTRTSAYIDWIESHVTKNL